MARAAVKAKQAQAAQAQAAANASRKQRKHAAGGNPNQDLFFTRLRRKQKWVFFALAIIFAVSFVVARRRLGSGGGLEQLYNSILGGGGDAVAKAKAEIKNDPAKGYQDLATAYLSEERRDQRDRRAPVVPHPQEEGLGGLGAARRVPEAAGRYGRGAVPAGAAGSGSSSRPARSSSRRARSRGSSGRIRSTQYYSQQNQALLPAALPDRRSPATAPR